MRKLFFIFLSLFIALLPMASLAQENNSQDAQGVSNQTVYISFFHGEGCPHCAKAATFLEKMSNEYNNLDFKAFEIYNNPSNAKLLGAVTKKLGISVSGVPVIFIGDEYVYGYLNDETTGAQIKSIIDRQSITSSRDVVGELISEQSSSDNEESQTNNSQENNQGAGIINLPIVGEIDTSALSLPILTIIIGGIDGFNPCAMWVLIFLISLLLGTENKRKMWTLGLTFIIASGVVYFLFLTAWLNLFLFLGFIAAVRIAIGVVAIGSGLFHLKEWKTNKEGACKVADQEKKKKIMERLRNITSQKSFILAMLGIAALAFAVNLIELVCSAGLPAIYTNILSMSGLNGVERYLLLLLYILIFMLDDILVFVIAMVTLQSTGISAKYSRWSNLIGGIVILILGILLIFKPGWIMFG